MTRRTADGSGLADATGTVAFRACVAPNSSTYPAAPSIVPLHHTRTPLAWAKSAVSREIASHATTGIAAKPAFRRIAARRSALTTSSVSPVEETSTTT